MDKLARDAANARKKGMSYGQYMAQKKPDIILPKKTNRKMRECQRCGKPFPLDSRGAGVKKFCSDECREKFYDEREAKIRKEQMPEIHKTCPICGKDFIAKSGRYKYCGDFCKRLAATEQSKQCQQRRRERMSNGNDQML